MTLVPQRVSDPGQKTVQAPAPPGTPSDAPEGAPRRSRIPFRADIARAAHRLADSLALELVILLLSAGTTVIAGKFPGEILAFRRAHSVAEALSWVSLFWVLLLLTVAAACVKRLAVHDARMERERDRHEGRERDRKTQEELTSTKERLARHADSVERSLQAVVTVDDLASFSNAHASAHDAYTLALEAAHAPKGAVAVDVPEMLRESIRVVLSAVATMVQDVEPSRPDAIYAVNLMRYYDVNRVSPQAKRVVIGRLFFCRRRTLNGYRGALDLDRRLSTSTVAQPNREDPVLVSMALPVPRYAREHPNVGTRWVVLPGAPYAFLERKLWGTDTEELLGLLKDPGWNIPSDVADKVVEYFTGEDGRAIKSLVSYPLMRQLGREPRAVLNIHCDHVGLLREPERRARLIHLLRPTSLMLLDLLTLLDRLDVAPVPPQASQPGRSRSGRRP